MCAISSDGITIYSGDVFDRDRKWTGRECVGGQSTVKRHIEVCTREVQMNWKW